MAYRAGVRFLPNAITILALCAGLSSIAFAHRSQWLLSVAMIATAAILDSLDGPAARLLHASSRIGAELDSLSDCVSFGVAPAVVIYLWTLDGHPIGWAICLVYAVCTTLRLARFNSMLDENPRPWAKGFFVGVPSPAGALLALVPLVLYTRFGDGWWTNKWLVASWLLFVGVLMISKLPSIALKHVFLPQRLILAGLVLLVLAVALTFYEPQVMLTAGLLLYLIHLPYAYWRLQHIRSRPELWYDNRRRQRIRSGQQRLRPRMPQLRRMAGRPLDRHRPRRVEQADREQRRPGRLSRRRLR